jgi:hypothetical protein
MVADQFVHPPRELWRRLSIPINSTLRRVKS